MEEIDARLAESPAVTVTCLPDGSVDRRYAVEDAAGHVESRADLGERIASGHAKSFLVDHETTEPGGQAVNAARQAHALGADTALYGHLDHAVFDALDCETHSMGRPADVAVFEFADDAVMFTEESPDVADWALADLERVADLDAALDADAVVWTNWASVQAGTLALEALAERAVGDGGWLVVDPGDVTVREARAVAPFLDALAGLEAWRVALSVNDDELAFLAEAVSDGGEAPATRADALALLRDLGALDVAALHAEDAAVAADAAGVTRCPNLSVDAVRYTGAGDRFSAGLAYALAADWPLDQALTLANACATFYVTHARSGDREALAAWLAERR
ncbi:carbohydrate kinase family protein [Halarchaeum sp. CBA1220]|uniref:carbohydrate kinase family protein n=1 Tax=Halarchaeum sp. CBA1220 TaxID=1853682 RepID=UPI000F3A985D|nr:carbohydrate kinase family protein [Halarchaeum sp. CBA1220]QLC33981.1 carbohydrate kinase family protein [Halarchaeum sp. CBA1220]